MCAADGGRPITVEIALVYGLVVLALVLFTPIAIGAAETLGADPRPFLFAVAVAASMSFLTPVGYQINTMIYGPGQYRFTDFLRVGGPLTLLVMVTATVLIPQIWPL